MNKPPMKSRSAAMDPAPPPHASWGVLGGGENLAETMIADQGLEEEAFLSARLGRVFQAERTGVEAPAMVSGEMASVVGAGEGAARRGERPEGKGGGGGRRRKGAARKATETLGFSSEQNGSPWRVRAGQIKQAIPGISPSLPPPPRSGWAFISLPSWAASPREKRGSVLPAVTLSA